LINLFRRCELNGNLSLVIVLILVLPSAIVLSQGLYGEEVVKRSGVVDLADENPESRFSFSMHASPQNLGAASCAASSCHAGPRASVANPTSSRGSEYTLWKELDPHARSWATIASTQSTTILTKLGILKEGKIVKPDAYRNCLACHNTSSILAGSFASATIMEGVGCEACHGSAQTWINTHFTTNGLSSGMIPLGPLVQRARLCVTCHVGSGDRDMNHDIIAAGHPALYFDMAVYHEQYPKHWREVPVVESDRRARLWLAGQIAMADAELELIQARARQSHTVSVWPELSLYTCVDCHKTLNGIPKPVGPASGAQLIKDGRANPRLWSLNGLSVYVELSPKGVDDDFTRRFEELKSQIRERTIDQKAIVETASFLRQQISACLNADHDVSIQEWNADRQRQLSQTLLIEPMVVDQWDAAARFYIAAWASRAHSENGNLMSSMTTLRKALVFPSNSQSPDFPRDRQSTKPPSFEEWRQALQQAAMGLQEYSRP
jgi:Cytochrome c554 and c-prime